MKQKIGIIGAGASGLIAAYFASQNKRNQVHIFEKQNKIGRKLAATGNGRCNLTNMNMGSEHYHSNNINFVTQVLESFTLNDTLKFFHSIGIITTTIDNGKVYPASLQASTVVKAFEHELSHNNVQIHTSRKIEAIQPVHNGFIITTAGKEQHFFNKIILACGSCAYGPLGASKDGYELAQSLGHTIIEPFPSILPVNITNKQLHTLQGIRWDCTLSVVIDNTVVKQVTDEVLFTAYGISGPGALSISRAVNKAILEGNDVYIQCNIFPYYDNSTLRILFEQLLSQPKKTLECALYGIMNNKMPRVFLSMAGIPYDWPAVESRDNIDAVINAFTTATLHPGKPRSFTEAVVAAGGVDVNEINPATMESTLHKGLFITGELLNVDGDSGGYNLQFAWSTGAIAGKNV
ncbi:MAG: NAD(P)/FAD-dependent oxidoreductase [Spirochaetes bacterium]|nr:NAD(P)/FAD-dependent oxidoreductase [Spirochaetota bacterium]